MSKGEILLELKNVTKRFPGVLALDNVELSIKKGTIHALIGENGAGKSTLMKCVLGMYIPDEGVMRYKGEECLFRSPAEALNHGISMIHQEISLVPTFDVAENVWLGREERFMRAGLINEKLRIQETREWLQKLDINLEPTRLVSSLTVAQKQLVELVRAVSYESDLIIMDEPTSALADAEIEKLYSIVRMLTQKGTAIIFISHKLDEIYEICETITVMRDGRTIDTCEAATLPKDRLIQMIADRKLGNMFPKTETHPGEVVLECRNLKAATGVNDVSFSVRKGEILGISGLMGAGRTEIMRALYGLDPLESGEIIIDGKPVKIKSPEKAIRYGIGMITEDRLISGTIGCMSVSDNITIAYLAQICNKFGFVNRRRERQDVKRVMKSVDIHVSGPEQVISEASGGNQQKAIIARWLLAELKVLILDEPTRGIDVGAKSEIHRLMDELVHRGMSVIMISSELPEILGMSDRILVVRNGKIAGEFDGRSATQIELMTAAFGVEKEAATQI